MLDNLPPAAVGALVAGLLSVVGAIYLPVRLILTGRLVPRSTYMDVVADRDELRKALQVSEQARVEMLVQNGQMMDALAAIQAAITAGRGPAPGQRRRGGR